MESDRPDNAEEQRLALISVLDINSPKDARILRMKSAPVTEEHIKSKDFNRFLDCMKYTMYKMQGIGLAAVQIGVPLRLAVIDTEWPHKGTPI